MAAMWRKNKHTHSHTGTHAEKTLTHMARKLEKWEKVGGTPKNKWESAAGRLARGGGAQSREVTRQSYTEKKYSQEPEN